MQSFQRQSDQRALARPVERLLNPQFVPVSVDAELQPDQKLFGSERVRLVYNLVREVCDPLFYVIKMIVHGIPYMF